MPNAPHNLCSRPYAFIQNSHAGMFQVMPHRCARLLLVAPADRSRNRMVLAPHKKPCLATKTSGRLGLSINARRDMTQQHRHGLLEQDVLAGPCDREVEAVIVG